MPDNFEQLRTLSPEKRALLALRLQKKQELSSAKQTIPAAPRNGDVHTFPLSFAQQRLWFLDQLEPGNPYYNGATAVRLEGTLDRAALKRSLNAIVQRHEALRTVFVTLAGEPVQQVLPALTISLPIIDLGEWPASERERQAQARCVVEARTPFDLAHGPLIRATLLQLGEAEHILLIVIHHIVADLWSMAIIIRELAALYAAYSTGGEPAPRPAPSIQYADFTVWQRAWLRGEALEKQIAYWKQQLDRAPGLLELPTDRPRPPIQSFQGGYQSRALSQTTTQALKALSQETGVTLFMLLLAAFKTLLYRYTRQSDILIGVPVLGRNRLELEEAVGCFINTLVLRTQLEGQSSFRELLGKVRQTALAAYAHQDLPFELLVEELHVERSLSRNPLFQVMFTFQDISLPTPELAGLTLRPFEFYSDLTKFDLCMFVAEAGQQLQVGVDYSTALFDADTITRLLAHFEVLLEGILANPDQPLAALPLLPETEKRRLLVEWNDTWVTYPGEATLPELFEAQVKRTPNDIALLFEGRQLTYQDLNVRANHLAHYLRRQGVGPETRVGICVERSIEMVVGLLGILKAGGAYLPLDPTYPAERLAFMLQDSGVPFLLTQSHLLPRLPTSQAQTICLDADWPAENLASGNPQSEASADNLAYVIYTSGSTGQPKGAMNIHQGIRNRLLWMQATYPLSASDRVLQQTPFTFDFSVCEIFWPLIVGARLVLAQPEGHKDSAYLVKSIIKQGITTMHFVPSMLGVFLDEPRLAECVSLQRVFSGGEPLPAKFQERFFARLQSELHNLYGPTEAAVDVTYWACQRGSQQSSVPIGQPIANTQLYILDRQGEPVPIGVAGELCIGGIGVGRGYLNRPELTAERFVPNPFTPTPNPSPNGGGVGVGGGRLYKTGDLARYLPDGNIEFLGRLDHQVKVRGFRIELGEIEATLDRHPAVSRNVVVVREGAAGDNELVAYVVAAAETKPTSADLRRFLHSYLPNYMLPAKFVFLAALPLLPNGKIDRRALPAPSAEHRKLVGDYVAPSRGLEEKLASIWKQVLGVDRVGRHDNFFEAGGHSLMALRLVSRLRDELGVEVPAQLPFQAQTIAELAEQLEKEAATEPAALPPVARVGEAAGQDQKKQNVFKIAGTTGFLLLSAGQIVSLVGSGMTCFAQSVWVYTDLGGSITQLTLMAILAQLPGVLISPLAGVLVDRWDRRWVMIISNAVAALATLLLQTLIVTHTFQLWHIYLITIILSIANHFQWPAFFATIPLVVPKKHLGSANGLVQMARALGQIAAPFMAGVAVTLFRIEGVILFDMVSYLVAFITLLIVAIPKPVLTEAAKSVRGSLKRELIYGWKYLLDRPGLMWVLALFAVNSFMIGVISLLFMPMALSTLSATTFGALASMGGISMILSSLIVSVWGVPKRRVNAVLIWMVIQGVAVVLGGLYPSPMLYMGAAMLFYFAAPIIGACSEVIWQSKTAPDVQGRVLAATWMASVVASLLGFLVAGPLADYVFEPWLAIDGPLAGSVGQLIGVGPGRGIGFLFILLGVLSMGITVLAWLAPRLQRVDEELPDEIDSVPASVATQVAMRAISIALVRD